MYEISIRGDFDAAHALRGYQGKCENLHGHRFEVVVTISSAVLNDIGIAYDFADLKQHLRAILSRFDHTNLNEVPPFNRSNPSSENLAVTIFEDLKSRLSGAPVKLVSVEVRESPTSRVKYTPD